MAPRARPIHSGPSALCQSQLTFRCFHSPPDTSMTGAPWATQFFGPLPFLAVVVPVVSSPSFWPVTTRMHPMASFPPAKPQVERGRASWNRIESLAGNGVGSNRMRTRVRTLDWVCAWGARGSNPIN